MGETHGIVHFKASFPVRPTQTEIIPRITNPYTYYAGEIGLFHLFDGDYLIQLGIQSCGSYLEKCYVMTNWPFSFGNQTVWLNNSFFSAETATKMTREVCLSTIRGTFQFCVEFIIKMSYGWWWLIINLIFQWFFPSCFISRWHNTFGYLFFLSWNL